MILTYVLGGLVVLLLFFNYIGFLAWKQERLARITLLTDIKKAEKEYETQAEDLEARFQELKKVPVIAAMTDQQVSVLGELLAMHIEKILGEKRNYVN